MGLGQPATILLHQFARLASDAFDATAYHVGSSLEKKEGFRDVDVRVIMPDEQYDAWFRHRLRPAMADQKWAALCLAFSVLGKQMTGLNIDFQIDRQSDANTEHKGKPRSALIFGSPIELKDNPVEEPGDDPCDICKEEIAPEPCEYCKLKDRPWTPECEDNRAYDKGKRMDHRTATAREQGTCPEFGCVLEFHHPGNCSGSRR